MLPVLCTAPYHVHYNTINKMYIVIQTKQPSSCTNVCGWWYNFFCLYVHFIYVCAAHSSSWSRSRNVVVKFSFFVFFILFLQITSIPYSLFPRSFFFLCQSFVTTRCDIIPFFVSKTCKIFYKIFIPQTKKYVIE